MKREIDEHVDYGEMLRKKNKEREEERKCVRTVLLSSEGGKDKLTTSNAKIQEMKDLIRIRKERAKQGNHIYYV